MSKVTISYGSAWNKNGTHYSQWVRIHCTRSEFDKNNRLMLRRKELSRGVMCDHNFDLYAKTLHEGVNYTNATTCAFFANAYGFADNKRYKTDRNTIIDIVITD